MPPEPLLQPIGALMHPVEALCEMDSIHRAAGIVRASRAGVAPYTVGGALVGMVTERSLATAFSAGASSEASCSIAVVPYPLVLPAHASGAEALRALQGSDQPAIVVVDQGRPIGTVAASDLIAGPPPNQQPPFIGGMATPFGIYLTTGTTSAGAGHVALTLTGALMFTLFLGGLLVTDAVLHNATHNAFTGFVAEALPVLIFLGGLRLMPLAAIHASEHQVVHAIERGELLELETVRRMPRVHPRCGTNIAAGASLFLGIASSNLFVEQEPRLLVAMVATLLLWRPLGAALQLFVTTKPAKDKQLLAAIKVGADLLKKLEQTPRRAPNFFSRLANSGLPHVMTGSLLAYGVAKLAAWAFGLPLDL